MAQNYFTSAVNKSIKKARAQTEKAYSKILYGTVKQIDPLEIEIEDGIVLPSEFFQTTPAVETRKVRMIVHRIYGAPEIVTFRAQADDIAEEITAAAYNRTVAAPSYADNYTATTGDSGASVLSPPDDYGVSGNIFSKSLTMSTANRSVEISNPSIGETYNAINKTITASGNIAFRMEFTETGSAAPVQDKNIQNQTVAIEGIIWQGMRVDDNVLMTSHKSGEKLMFLIHKITNRKREIDDYEQASIWYSRYNDISAVRDMERVETDLPPRPF